MKRILAAAIVLLALAVATTGAIVWIERQAEANAIPADTVGLAGLTATVGQASWAPMANHHMDNPGGYRMPSQMMPGAPDDGLVRLGVPVTLVNDGDSGSTFDPLTEFTLVGPDGASTLYADTFGTLARLSPGAAVNGVLYFDIAPPADADPPPHLVWRRAGEEGLLAVRLPGTTSHSGHTP